MVLASPISPAKLAFQPGEQLVVAVPKHTAQDSGEYQFLLTIEGYVGDEPREAERVFGRSDWRHVYRVASATTVEPFSLTDVMALAGSRAEVVRERYRGQTQHHRIIRSVFAEDEPLFRSLIRPGTEPVWVASTAVEGTELATLRQRARNRSPEDIIRRLRTMSSQSAKTQPGKQYRPGKTQKRNAEFTELVRALYSDTCQVCGLQLRDVEGVSGRSQVHHLEPWAGDCSDRLDNVICVCPNDHARFELGTLVWSQGALRSWTADGWSPLPLKLDHHLSRHLTLSAASERFRALQG
jgi:hypothetical protein